MSAVYSGVSQTNIVSTENLLLIPPIMIITLVLAVRQCRGKNNPFGLTNWLWPMGAFVWGDVLVLAIFWIIASLVAFFVDSTLLFWLIFSVFWVVRSAGEVIYWFLEQFSAKVRNKPTDLLGHSFVNGSEAIWFIYQVFWQCVLVVALIASVWLGAQFIS